MVRYENYCKVNTPVGIGTIKDVDEMSSPVVKYEVELAEGGVREFAEQQIHPMIDPSAFDKYGKMLASETVTTARGDIHFIFTYEFNHALWYYSYFIDTNGVKHLKQLELIRDFGECE